MTEQIISQFAKQEKIPTLYFDEAFGEDPF